MCSLGHGVRYTLLVVAGQRADGGTPAREIGAMRARGFRGFKLLTTHDYRSDELFLRTSNY